MRELLIVEDEDALAQRVAAFLRRSGYEVCVALTAGAALEVLRTRAVDGLLIDFRLPDMRGDVLLSAAVALQPHLVDRVIFLTGDVSGTVPEALVDFDCPVIRKPFGLAEVGRILKATFDSARSPKSESC